MLTLVPVIYYRHMKLPVDLVICYNAHMEERKNRPGEFQYRQKTKEFITAACLTSAGTTSFIFSGNEIL